MTNKKLTYPNGSPIISVNLEDCVDPDLDYTRTWLSNLVYHGWTKILKYPLKTEIDTNLDAIELTTESKNNCYLASNSIFAWNLRSEVVPVFTNIWPNMRLATSIEGIQKTTISDEIIDIYSKQQYSAYGNRMCSVNVFVPLSNCQFIWSANSNSNRVSLYNSIHSTDIDCGDLLVYDSRLYCGVTPRDRDDSCYGLNISMQPYDAETPNSYKTKRADIITSNRRTENVCFGDYIASKPQLSTEACLKPLTLEEVRNRFFSICFA